MDKHRRSMSGLKVEETQKWGTAKAYSRYGVPDYLNGAPKPADLSSPLGGPRYDPNVPSGGWTPKGLGDIPNDWRHAAGEDATTYPGFDKKNPWRKGGK
jgi:hypothetical protein